MPKPVRVVYARPRTFISIAIGIVACLVLPGSLRLVTRLLIGWEEAAAVPEAVEALRELRIDLSQHQARRLNRSQLEEADLVLAMAAEHRDAAIRLSPSASPRTFTLKELVDLLRHADAGSGNGDASRRLEARIAEASRLRVSRAVHLSDEDVADPLGGGVESFRATAWEIEALCEQLFDLLFEPDPGAAHRERAERTARGGDR